MKCSLSSPFSYQSSTVSICVLSKSRRLEFPDRQTAWWNSRPDPTSNPSENWGRFENWGWFYFFTDTTTSRINQYPGGLPVPPQVREPWFAFQQARRPWFGFRHPALLERPVRASAQ